MLANILSRYWWMTLLRGIVAILFGFFVIAQPGISLMTLTMLFGAFVLLDGIGSLTSAFGGRTEHESWWIMLLWGLCGIAVGVMTFFSPGVTAFALLFYIAAWAIVTGVIELVAAFRLRQEIEGEFWLGLLGVLSIAFGVFMMVRPGAGILSLLWLIAAYAIAFGITLIALAFRMRGFVKRLA